MASDVLAFSPTQVEKIFKSAADSSPALCTDDNSLFHNDAESSEFASEENNLLSSYNQNAVSQTPAGASVSNFEKEIGSVDSDDDDEVQPVKSKSKQKALTEKQREAEKLKLHSESQRIMRS